MLGLALDHADKIGQTAASQQIGNGVSAAAGPYGCIGRRGTIGEIRYRCDGAPCRHAGIAWRLRSQHLRTDDRMNTVCAQQDIAENALPRIKSRDYTRFRLFIANHLPAETYRLGGPCDERIVQRLNKVSTVNVKIVSAPAIDGCAAERNIKQAPTAATKPHLKGFRPEGVLQNARGHAEPGQDMHAIGTELDTGPDLIKNASLFKNLNVVSEMLERQRCRQASNASACYQDAHPDTPLVTPRRSSRARRVLLAADQNESPVTILALDEIIIAHFIPDARMAQGPAAAIARHLMAPLRFPAGRTRRAW